MTSKRLRRLVRLKKLVEQQRAAELAEERTSLGAAERTLEDLRAEAVAAEGAVDHLGVTAGELVRASAWQDQLGERATEQQEVVAQAVGRVAEQAEIVRDAWMDRRLLEGVHGRAQKRELAADADAERKRNDDIALRSYGRGGGEA